MSTQMNAKLIARLQLFCCAAVLMCVPTARTSGQTTPEIARIVANNQYNLSSTGQQFLQQQANKASFVLVGGLHGDNETQKLLNVVMNGLAEGPRLIITEMSPWAANRLLGANADSPGMRVRGADIEEAQLPSLIRELATANPDNRVLQEMAASTKEGYRRELAPDLLALAGKLGSVNDSSPGGIVLSVLLTRTLEVEVDRSKPATADLQASLRREGIMKDFFLMHYRAASAGGVKPTVVAVFGRNHMHRGVDRRGVSTLGNFMAEFGVSEGRETFNVALFAAGGKVAFGGVRDIDETKDDPALAYLASTARYPATVFDLKPLREALRRIPVGARTPSQASLLYWADSYDAVVCHGQVTPMTSR